MRERERERDDGSVVLRNVSQSRRSVYKLACWALRLVGEVGEGDLQGNSLIDTSFVLQVIMSRDSCATWWPVSLTQRIPARKLQRTPQVRIVLWRPPWIINFDGCNPSVILNFCEKIRILLCWDKEWVVVVVLVLELVNATLLAQHCLSRVAMTTWRKFLSMKTWTKATDSGGSVVTCSS